MALFDRALIKKYDKPGPRYTSYPTAPHLSEDFGVEALERAIERSNASGRPLSLYVHIPFCRSLCLYCACNVVITRRPDRVEAYLDYLDREIGMVGDRLDTARPVVQLHWGGGTPSYLSPSQIRRVGAMLSRRFAYDEHIEASVEIDPRLVTREHVEAFREVGFTRVSMGVQDVDPHVQETVNRVQPIEVTRQVIQWSRDVGFESVNIDLMYGLPHQRPETYESTVQAALDFGPDRLAVFNYAHVPWMKRHQAALPEEAMPTPDQKLEILRRVIERLMAAGYVFIGMDHFARPDDELAVAQREGTLWRNFQGYTTRAGTDLVGFGVTSIGLFDDAYYQNQRDLDGYYGRIAEGRLPVMRGIELSFEDRLRRKVIMELMSHFRLQPAAIEREFGIDFWSHFEPEREALRQFEGDGLLSVGPSEIAVSESGRLLIRNIAMTFDAYLSDGESRFSRTV